MENGIGPPIATIQAVIFTVSLPLNANCHANSTSQSTAFASRPDRASFASRGAILMFIAITRSEADNLIWQNLSRHDQASFIPCALSNLQQDIHFF